MMETEKRYRMGYVNPRLGFTLIIALITSFLIGLIVLLHLWLQISAIVTIIIIVAILITSPLILAYWYYKNRMLSMEIVVRPDEISIYFPQSPEITIERSAIVGMQYGLPRWKSNMLGRERLQIRTLDQDYEVHNFVFDEEGRKMLYDCYLEIRNERDQKYNNYWS